MNNNTPVPVPDLLVLAEKDPQKALAILRQQSDFHRPTRSKHLRLHNSSAQVVDEPTKDKKKRKMAAKSVSINRKHANRKHRPTGSKKVKGRK